MNHTRGSRSRPYHVFAEIDEPSNCHLPQSFFLPLLEQMLPQACFVLTLRPTDDWISSVKRWKVGFRPLFHRMVDRCPIHPKNESGLRRLFEEHNARARLVVERARCGAVIDVSRSDDEVGRTLAEEFPGTDPNCWGQSNRNSDRPANTSSATRL